MTSTLSSFAVSLTVFATDADKAERERERNMSHVPEEVVRVLLQVEPLS